MKKYLFLIILSFLCFPSLVSADCPTAINFANTTITEGNTCAIPSGETYIIEVASDESSTTNIGELRLTGGSLTINNTGILKAGKVIPDGGTIIIQDGGVITIGGSSTAIWVDDADVDGYTPNLTTTYTATAAGRRRLGLMKSTTLSDCYDSNNLAYPGSTACSSTNRGDGSYDYNCNTLNDTCGTSYYTSRNIYTNYSRACGSSGNECCPLSNRNVTYNAVGCSTTGYSRGSSFVINPTCSSTYNITHYNLGATGPQGCQ